MATRISSTDSPAKESRRTAPDLPAPLHPSTRKRLGLVVSALLKWHQTNKTSYIWRGLRRTPYEVLVSEFMLQQTGARQIEKKLPEFLKLFPTAKKLAAATRSDVIRAWQGLGYNRRAINLHNTAKALAATSTFPKTHEELLGLPGIGQYTASAVRAFAFNEDVPVVDVNVHRVLSRVWKPSLDPHTVLPVSEIVELDRSILPNGKSAAWHEALMDLGSSICTKQKPRCAQCPLQNNCPSAKHLKGISHQRNPDKASEPLFFGQPRRIWRGRILKIITDAHGVTDAQLGRVLHEKYPVALSGEMSATINQQGLQSEILSSLKTEGFITISKGRITLAHD